MLSSLPFMRRLALPLHVLPRAVRKFSKKSLLNNRKREKTPSSLTNLPENIRTPAVRFFLAVSHFFGNFGKKYAINYGTFFMAISKNTPLKKKPL